jgi:hypothetical protein
MINGDGKMPPRSPPPEAKPAEPARAGRSQRGFERLELPRVSVETLKKLNHAEWLDNFARVMQLKTGVEMTPTRQGVIGRLGLAAEYIRLLEHEVRKLEKIQAAEDEDVVQPEGR